MVASLQQGTRRQFLSVSAGAALAGLLNRANGTVSGRASKFAPRLALCNELFRANLEGAIAAGAEFGYDGLELAPFTLADSARDLSAAQRTKIRQRIERAGLATAGLHWLLARTKGLHLTSPDRQVRRRTAEYLGVLAELCAALGGKVLVFGSPKQRNLGQGVSREQGYDYAAEVIELLLPTLERTDTVLALEPLSPRATNFMTTAAEAVQLIERIGSPRCRLNLDCLAMSSEQRPAPELIRGNARWLAHFHANDPNGQGPGFGTLDFVPILAALAAINYTGWVSVEVFDYRPGPRRLAKESIHYLRQSLATLAKG